MSIFDWTLPSVPSWSSNMRQARHCQYLNQSQNLLGFFVLNFITVHLAVGL